MRRAAPSTLMTIAVWRRGLEFNDITSHDVMLSARYKFGCGGGDAPMPVSFK